MVDYQGLIITTTLCALLAAAGALIDKFMLTREKNRLTGVLEIWWRRVEAVNLSDAPEHLASSFLSLERKLFGVKVISFEWILKTLAVSVILTALVLFIAVYTFYLNIETTVSLFLSRPRMFYLFLVNYIFDFCTVVFTVLVMQSIVYWNSQLLRIGLLTVDAIAALLLALAVYTLANSIVFWGDGYSSIEPTGFQIEYLKMDVRGFFSFFELAGVFDWGSNLAQYLQSLMGEWFGPHHDISLRGWQTTLLSNFLPAITTLLPTILWLLAMFVVTCSILTLSVGRIILIRLFELDATTDKSIFFYTGLLIGFLGVTVKLLLDLNKLVLSAPQL